MQRLSSIYVKTRRSFDWKLVDSVFTPLDEQVSFTLEGCGDDEGLNVHGNLPSYSHGDLILARYLVSERDFINPPWELADEIGQHFEHCRHTTLQSTLAVFILPKRMG
jgi:hypothetical protein